jgi:hypothetical protein
MVYETRNKTKKNSHKANNVKEKLLNVIKVRRHCSYGYSAVPTRLGKFRKSNNIISSPITLKYSRIFPDGHLLIMDIKENNISTQSISTQNNIDHNSDVHQIQGETKIEWLSRISKYQPILEIKITGDNSDFYPFFHLKAIRVFKEYSDDVTGCVQLFNADTPLSITFYHPDEITIRVIQ